MKKELRKEFRTLRNIYSGKDKASRACEERFLNSEEYQRCKALFIFLSFGSEIETRDIIDRALEDKKLVALPYMTGKPHEMLFLKIQSLKDLVKNSTGIYEPVFKEENTVVSDKDTIIVVPGLAFDKNGYRIGYGGGYYDKYMSENEYMKAIGLCFDFQITDSIPTDEYDVKSDIIITDRRVIK